MPNDNGRIEDPFAGFNFKVEIEGLTEAHFSQVSGLSVETEVVEYQEGGLNEYTHKLKGQTKYPNIVLKRGITTSREFVNWMQDSISNKHGKAQRKSGSIILYDHDGRTEKRRWTFVRAWPAKWEGPAFDAGQSQALIETLELAHEGLVFTK